MGKLPKKALMNSHFLVDTFTISGWSKQKKTGELVKESDLIILGGGHVPTQNKFFREIYLKKYLKEYEGVIVGVSAGSMNCAKTVYAMPELPGEYLDKKYQRYLPGLEHTKQWCIPTHYNEIHDDCLDGVHIYSRILLILIVPKHYSTGGW